MFGRLSFFDLCGCLLLVCLLVGCICFVLFAVLFYLSHSFVFPFSVLCICVGWLSIVFYFVCLVMCFVGFAVLVLLFVMLLFSWWYVYVLTVRWLLVLA